MANNAVRLRKLSRKSVIGFGKYADNTVQEIIDDGKGDYIVWLYYNINNIDFLDDIKAEVRIEELIDKPSTNPELGEKIRHQRYQETWEGMNEEEKFLRRCKLKTITKKKHRLMLAELEHKEKRGCKRSVLQMFNHGNNRRNDT